MTLISLLAGRIAKSTREVTLLTAKLRAQKENIRDAFLIEIREAQSKRNVEEDQRRDHKERAKAEERTKQEEAEDEATLRQLLSSNDSLHHDKSTCIPGTRASILSELAAWAKEASPDLNRLFWLYGVAGCGKSAVAASISKDLDDAGRLTGSFFCKREEEERRDHRR